MSERRLPALDVLRGIAIAGTLATNIWLFADPGGPAAALTGFAGGWWVDDVLRAAANGKFLALLTLMFGIGMELQYRSAVRRGMRRPGRYLARAAILFAEGLLHYVLVFEFDVLMGYAVASVLVAWLIGRSRAVRVTAGAVAGGFVLLVVGALTLATSGLSGDDVPLPGYPPTWTGQVWERLTQPLLYRIELVMIVPSGIVLFLAGASLLRAGVLDERGARLRRVLIAVGALGAVLTVATALAGPDWFVVERYLVAPLVAAGLLGLVTELVLRLRGPAGPVRRGATAVGRTALTCYVGQNVVASVLFHAWGFGLAGTLTTLAPPARTAVVVAVWALIMAGSALAASWWLRRHTRGPLEALTHAILDRVPAGQAGTGAEPVRDRSPASHRGTR